MKKKFNKLNIFFGFLASIIAIITFVMLFLPKTSNHLSGKWKMTSTITSADLKTYIDATVEWKMFMTELDGKIIGTAEKIKINGIAISYDERTSMSFEGIVEKDSIILNYTEEGKIRKTNGIMKVGFQENTFSGIFSQTASNTSGTIIGLKIK